MKTNYVLIDYENTPVKSLVLLEAEHFRVRVFCGPTNAKIPLALAKAIQEFGDRAKYVELESGGKNALDFHIAYYLGVYATKEPSAFFHIISKDTGFDPLVRHLKGAKVFCARSASIEEMPCFFPEPVEPDVEGTPEPVSVQSFIDLVVADLIKRKTAKPRTAKTLLATLHTRWAKEVPSDTINAVFARLVKEGYVKVEGDKVTYALSN